MVSVTQEITRRAVLMPVLCIGMLVIGVDATIVNIALPSIQADLGISEDGLVWIVNAYLLTFSGLMLVVGRLGDLIGNRRLFLLGVALFTAASVVCGFSRIPAFLIGARAVQGTGGAVVSVMALSLLLRLFEEGPARTKALGIVAFTNVLGGTCASLLGGFITSELDWRWIFFVNVPVGTSVYVLAQAYLPRENAISPKLNIDAAGAVAATASLMFALCAAQAGPNAGSQVSHAVIFVAISVALAAIFLRIEALSRVPLVPTTVLRYRNLWVATVVETAASAAVYIWGFMSTLYLQRVLRYTALDVALAILPSSFLAAVLPLGAANKWVGRWGNRIPVVTGLLLSAVALMLLARRGAHGSYLADVLPASLLLGIGIGIVPIPLTVMAMADVLPTDSGVASGLINTASMMGAALGLAAASGIAAVRTRGLEGIEDPTSALSDGYQLALLGGALLMAIGALVSLTFFRSRAALQRDDWPHP